MNPIFKTAFAFLLGYPSGSASLNTSRQHSERLKYEGAMRRMDSHSFPEIDHSKVVETIRAHPEWSVADTGKYFDVVREALKDRPE